MKRSLLHSMLPPLFALLFSGAVYAADFIVSDIRIEGLQQVDPGLVFRNFPISRGDLVSQKRLNDATRDLFESGYFDDVEILRDGEVLVLRLKERPSVALIRLDGNKMIKEEQLRDALRSAGLDEGDIFRRSALDQIRLELLKVYNGAGRYNASVDTEAETLEGNRVALNIKISEGKTAVIKKINIVGNQAFDDDTLLGLFDSGLTNYMSWWSDNDKYARERLSADIERLKSWYLDRGYLKFEVNSSQVSVSPDQSQVYVTINITEGQQYYYDSVDIAGDYGVPEEDLRAELDLIVAGEVFSRRDVVDTQQRLQKKLSVEGYMFARVNPVPEVVGDNGVALKFYLEPGKLTYVRRIEIRGNSTTADEVIRRELPQMEGAIARADLIDEAKIRLDRLGFFNKVAVTQQPVAGTDDQIDIEIEIEEAQLGQLSAGVGFSSAEGLLLQLGLQQKNFLGSGNDFGFNLTSSSVQTEYSFNFTDPYYTLDGVSQGYNAYYRTRDFGEADTADYTTDSLGGGIDWGYPIDENRRVRIGVGVDLTTLKANPYSSTGLPQTIEDFMGAGVTSQDYLTYELNLGWSSNYLNSGLFPTRGSSQSVDLSVAVPGGDLTYYKAIYSGRYYYPLDRDEGYVLGFKARGGYADSLDSQPFPFFKNFFAGGLTTVRGYANNSLGPRDNLDPIGGNVLLTGSAEFIFPMPFVDDKDSWRTALFVDAGNVYATSCGDLANCSDTIDLSDLRVATGLALSWLTPIGPLSLAYGKALNDQSGDTTETIQFAIGRTF